MGNSVVVPVDIKVNVDDVAKNYKNAINQAGSISQLEKMFNDFSEKQKKIVDELGNIKDSSAKAFNIRNLEIYSDFLNKIISEVKHIDKTQLDKFQLPTIKIDGQEIKNAVNEIHKSYNTAIKEYKNSVKSSSKDDFFDSLTKSSGDSVKEYFKERTQIAFDSFKKEGKGIEKLIDAYVNLETITAKLTGKKVRSIEKVIPSNVLEKIQESAEDKKINLTEMWSHKTTDENITKILNGITLQLKSFAKGFNPIIDDSNLINVGEFEAKIKEGEKRLEELASKWNKFKAKDNEDLATLLSQNNQLDDYLNTMYEIRSVYSDIEEMYKVIGAEPDSLKKFNITFSDDAKAIAESNNIEFWGKLTDEIFDNLEIAAKKINNAASKEDLLSQLKAVNSVIENASRLSVIEKSSKKEVLDNFKLEDGSTISMDKLIKQKELIISKLKKEQDGLKDVEEQAKNTYSYMLQAEEIRNHDFIGFAGGKSSGFNSLGNGDGDASSAEIEELRSLIEDLTERVNKLETETPEGVQNNLNELKEDIKKVNNKIDEDMRAKIDAKTLREAHSYAEQLSKIIDSFNSNSNIIKIEEKFAELTATVNGFVEALSQIYGKDIVPKFSQGNTPYITNEDGTEKIWYRGVNGMMGNGTFSTGYGGAVFLTDNLEVASKAYAGSDGKGKIEKAKIIAKKTWEIDGDRSSWREIEYLGNNTDEASQEISSARWKMESSLEKLSKIVELTGVDIKKFKPTDQQLNAISKNFSSIVKDIGNFSNGERQKIEKQIANFEQAKKDYLAISNNPTNPYGIHSTDDFVEYAKQAKDVNGQHLYDSILFKDIYDGTEQSENQLSTVGVVLSQDQLHYIETLTANGEKILKEAATEVKNKTLDSDKLDDFYNKLHSIEDIIKSLNDVEGLAELTQKINNLSESIKNLCNNTIDLPDIKNKIENLSSGITSDDLKKALEDIARKTDIAEIGNNLPKTSPIAENLDKQVNEVAASGKNLQDAVDEATAVEIKDNVQNEPILASDVELTEKKKQLEALVKEYNDIESVHYDSKDPTLYNERLKRIENLKAKYTEIKNVIKEISELSQDTDYLNNLHINKRISSKKTDKISLSSNQFSDMDAIYQKSIEGLTEKIKNKTEQIKNKTEIAEAICKDIESSYNELLKEFISILAKAQKPSTKAIESLQKKYGRANDAGIDYDSYVNTHTPDKYDENTSRRHEALLSEVFNYLDSSTSHDERGKYIENLKKIADIESSLPEKKQNVEAVKAETEAFKEVNDEMDRYTELKEISKTRKLTSDETKEYIKYSGQQAARKQGDFEKAAPKEIDAINSISIAVTELSRRIEDKTESIKAEAEAMKQAAEVEITAINSVQDAMLTPAPDKNKKDTTEQPKKHGRKSKTAKEEAKSDVTPVVNNDSDTIKTEITDLNGVAQAADNVKIALDNKTEAIKNEQAQMNTSAKAEVEDLGLIKTKVKEVQNAIKKKAEAIAAEKLEMESASKAEVQDVENIRQSVNNLKNDLTTIPPINLTGETDGVINVSVDITAEQIKAIRQKLTKGLNDKNAIPLSFIPEIESVKKQISNALKDIPIEISSKNIKNAVKIEKFTAGNDGVKDLKEKIGKKLTNIEIQSFKINKDADKVKALKNEVSKLLNKIEINFDIEKLKTDIESVVSAATEQVRQSISAKNVSADNDIKVFRLAEYNELDKQIKKAKKGIAELGSISKGIIPTELSDELSDISTRLNGVSALPENANTEQISNWNYQSEQLLETWEQIKDRIYQSMTQSGKIGEANIANTKSSDYTRKKTRQLNDFSEKNKGKLTDQQFSELEKMIHSVQSEVDSITENADKYTANNVESIESGILNIKDIADSYKNANTAYGSIQRSISKLTTSRNSLVNRGSDAEGTQKKIDEKIAELQRLQSQFATLNWGDPESVTVFINNINKATTDAMELKNVAQNIKIGQNEDAGANKLKTRFDELIFKIEEFRKKNSRLNSDKILSAQFDALTREVATSEITSQNLQKLKAEFARLQNTVTSKGKTGRSLGDEISYIMEKIGLKAILGGGIYDIINAFKQMAAIVKELDTGMTNLKRVSNETEKVYSQFLSNTGDRARNLGATMTDVVNATTGFSRLGYDLEEASKLADNAMMYKNVGEIDVDTATADIISTIKAYDMVADDSEHIVDVFNKLGNEFAVSSAQIGSGLNESASALATANNSFEESAAMITAITEITQDASSAGRVCPKIW